MEHAISLPVAAGVQSSNDLTSQTDLTFRRSKRFRSKVLSYWDFEHIATLPTAEGNKTVIARDVPGEGTVIIEAQQPSILVESTPIESKDVHKAKKSMRKQASKTESTGLIHPALQQAKRISLSSNSSSTASCTPNKTKLSGSCKKRRLFSGEQLKLDEECCKSGPKVSRPPVILSKVDKNNHVKSSRESNKTKGSSSVTPQQSCKSRKNSKTSKNVQNTLTSSSKSERKLDSPKSGIDIKNCHSINNKKCIGAASLDKNGSTDEAKVTNKRSHTDEADTTDKVGDSNARKCDQDCEDVIEEETDEVCANESLTSQPKTAASNAHPPSLEDPGYSTASDSFSETMAGSELQFARVSGTNVGTSPTGQYYIARGVAKAGISVYFLHMTKGYLAFRTPLKMVFIGIAGEGLFKQLNESKPSVEMVLRSETEVRADKDVVVAINCGENCSNLTVCMVMMADNSMEGSLP